MSAVTNQNPHVDRNTGAAPPPAGPPPLRAVLRLGLLEFLAVIGNLFLVMTLARWIFHPSSPLGAHLTSLDAKLAAMGIGVGLYVTAAFAISVRYNTAGQLNPSVTVGLWAMRLLPGRLVLPFVVAQLAGSVAGVALGRLVWGPKLAEVGYAGLVRAPGWTWAPVFALEAAFMLVLMLLVVVSLVKPRFGPWLPPLTGAGVAAQIIWLSTKSGGGGNPARQFGPGLFSGRTELLWVYLLAPVVGSLLAGAVAALTRRPAPHQR
ncbi:aquaporin [Kitasatospora sp. GP82]|uniref:aquaporin n=1 Tax=Kitasatospora sp. GP82 TaxID=3035089 RepID=UPI002474DBE4|nr:aquaporin [Kitasatospora sp. GP82]MDH6123962.1 glycerol uptake facilitator-like aquaporin [Kitasatospora sp. GP82]